MMMSQPIPTVARGVTTVLPELREPGETVDVLNCVQRLTTGVTRRGPTAHLTTLPITIGPKGSFVHGINRDATNRYLMTLYDNAGTPAVSLVDSEGVTQTVTPTAGALSYLGSVVDYSTDIVALSLRDTTYLVNRKATVAASVSNGRTRVDNTAAILYVRAIAPDLILKVQLDGGTVVSTTATLDSTTNSVAIALRNSLASAYPGFTFTVSDGSIYVVKAGSATFTLNLEDSLGGDSLVGVVNRVQATGDLPPSGVHGFSIEVVGSAATNQDNFYLTFVGLNPSNTTTPQRGTWVETYGPNEPIAFSGMPIVLQKTGATTWDLKETTWDSRSAGDSLTAPMPGFVGKTINDVIFHKNRLGFISGDRLTLSRAGDFNGFWRKSAQILVDDDPIDIGIQSADVSDLLWGVPYDSSLILFASNGQYEITSRGEVFGPRTVQASPIGNFEVSRDVRPTLVGPSILFTVPTGQFQRVYSLAYYPEGRGYTYRDLTDRTTGYVSGNPLGIRGVTRENLAVVPMDDGGVFVWHWDRSGESPQSAWGRWSLQSTGILGAAVFDSKVFYVVTKGSQVLVLVQDLAIDQTDPSGVYRTHLDFQATEADCTIVYDGVTNTTTITPPVTPTVLTEVYSRVPEDIPGEQAPVVSYGSGNIVVSGDWSAKSFYVGETYVSRIDLSPPVLRSQSGPLFTGRIQVRNVAVLAKDAGYFEVLAGHAIKATATYTFTGKVLGSLAFTLDDPTIQDVRKRFGVLTQNTQAQVAIRSDGILGFSIMALEWECKFHRRSPTG